MTNEYLTAGASALPSLKFKLLQNPSLELIFLKFLPQALDNTSLIKAKPLGICLPCLLMQKVAVSFYGEIEIIAISLLGCQLD